MIKTNLKGNLKGYTMLYCNLQMYYYYLLINVVDYARLHQDFIRLLKIRLLYINVILILMINNIIEVR